MSIIGHCYLFSDNNTRKLVNKVIRKLCNTLFCQLIGFIRITILLSIQPLASYQLTNFQKTYDLMIYKKV